MSLGLHDLLASQHIKVEVRSNELKRFFRLTQAAVQVRRDDLESLGYVMLYFLRGSLPWQGLKAHDAEVKDRLVMEKKMELSVEQLCSGLPSEFAEYMRCVRALEGRQRPPYRRLRNLFRGLAEREGIEYDNVYDWTERIFLRQENPTR